MKNSVSVTIVRRIVAVAFCATAAFAGGCVMDASPEPTPSTGSNTSEVDRTVQAPNGVVGIPAPVSNEQIAPKINGALGPVDHSMVHVPSTPELPRIVAPPGIDDPGGLVEEGPRPHPWEPSPDDDQNTENKPKIGGSEQSSDTTSTGK